MQKQNLSLNNEKLDKLSTINREVIKIKAIGKEIIEAVRSLPKSSKKTEVLKHAKFMIREANTIARQARKFRSVEPTPELVLQLDSMAKEMKEERLKFIKFL